MVWNNPSSIAQVEYYAYYTDKYMYLWVFRRGQVGGRGGARPPLFAPNSLKNPLNLPNLGASPEPPAPTPFSNPGCAPGISSIMFVFYYLRYGDGEMNKMTLHAPAHMI